MATMSHGGKTSRGAGAAQRGYDYDVYRKGGKVKKYAEGGALRDEKGDYKRDPLTGTREYASFSDWMGDLFGKGKKAPESKSDYSAGAVKKEPLPAPKSSSEENTGAGDRIRQESLDRDEAFRASRPRATESLPTRPTSQQRRMTRRAAGTEFLSTDPAVTGPSRSRIPRPMTEEERAAIAGFVRPVDLRVPRRPRLVPFKSIDDMRLENHRGGARRLDSKGYWETSRGVPFFRKGGSVKMAGGGTCRGMGAATKGGKYTIK
jgi:hypothetical protein